MSKPTSNTTAVTLKGSPVTLFGDFPVVGKAAPDFTLVDKDLKDVGLKDFAGKRKVLNIVPSLDTAVCATSARKFNEAASKLDNTVVLVISADLPFAMSRFCVAEGLENVITLSLMRGRDFIRNNGDPKISVAITARSAEGDPAAPAVRSPVAENLLKERIQSFKGDVLKRQGRGFTATFTVRKMSDGVGVERLFPLFSPNIDSIVLNKSGRVRRAKLFYLRERSGKSARIKEKKQIHASAKAPKAAKATAKA